MTGDEPQERVKYREKCRYHSDYGTCLKYSGWCGSFHTQAGCTPKSMCRRMMNYDNRNRSSTTANK